MSWVWWTGFILLDRVYSLEPCSYRVAANIIMHQRDLTPIRDQGDICSDGSHHVSESIITRTQAVPGVTGRQRGPLSQACLVRSGMCALARPLDIGRIKLDRRRVLQRSEIGGRFHARSFQFRLRRCLATRILECPPNPYRRFTLRPVWLVWSPLVGFVLCYAVLCWPCAGTAWDADSSALAARAWLRCGCAESAGLTCPARR